MDWDVSLFELLNRRLTHPWLDVLMPVATSSETWRLPLAAAILAVAVFGTPRLRRIFVVLALCVGVSDLISSRVAKLLFHVARPSFALSGVRLLIGAKKSFSFPSSHAANLAAAAWFLHRTLRRRWVSLVMLLVLVGISYSRIYVGVHYPSDVLGGALLGGGVGELFARAARSLRPAQEPDLVPEGAPPRESVLEEGAAVAHSKPATEPAPAGDPGAA